jgi:hypothetical protein
MEPGTGIFIKGVTMGKLENDLTDFFETLENLNGIIQSIKAGNEWQEVSEAAHRGLKLPLVNKYVKNIVTFASFPERSKPAHRPVKFEDSEEEKQRFIEYMQKGLSLREIGEIEQLKKDIVSRKIKRYGLK